MPQPDPILLIFLLTSLAAAGLLFTLALPAFESRERRKRRMSLALGDGGRVSPAAADSSSPRRKAIEKTLKQIEERQVALHGARSRPDLQRRLREAGMTWSLRVYWLVALAVACVAAILAVAAAGLPLLPALGVGVAVGLLAPHLFVSFRRRRRLAKFAAGFPDAIDVIVRGVRSGRPLRDCLAIVAADSSEPIRSEFRLAVEDQSVGLTVDEAVDRLAVRVPLQEVNFLSIVISIQNRTGGSLTEALGNLSSVLRARRQLRAKVKALSAEAKTSAGIIGLLPVIVAGLVHLTSPDYLALLYETGAGLMVLGACALWMSIGILVMRQMINFDI